MAILPLEGYRVIDFGWVWAGPMVGAILADLGAEVIKVESRGRLDNLRSVGRPISRSFVLDPAERELAGEEIELVPMFHNVNRNKLSLSLNLKHPQAPDLVRELVAISDVVLDNFTPQVLDRLGLGYEALRQIRPDLILISMSAAGQSGPLRDIRTYAPALTSLAGLEGLVGYAGGPVLGMLTFGYGDPSAAVWGALAVLAALYQRETSGQGQYIDMSQLEATVCLMGEAILEYELNGRVLGPQGNHRQGMSPHALYPGRGEDRWVAIAVATQEEWQGLCRALEDPAWTREERFADPARRQEHQEALDGRIAEWTRQHTPEEASEILQREGVAATPVLDIEGQQAHPHFQARQLYVNCHHSAAGPETLNALPWKLSEASAEVRRSAPLLGEHNAYILGELLGKTPAEIARLTEEKVLY
ncbi:MAG: CoA transferase [Candidatus Tectomicrobia bacterium]|uniref:CoA transferase n=1 Tax=Tectimicrobiota bacterium TaxID=2528274 RepID=A0A932CNM2_UNCTE|nr:CoA transferase [Candidatus Tectomicrobia bacterium]